MTTYGEASQAEYLRQRLEKLEAAGVLNEAQSATLERLRARQAANQAEIGATQARFRGAARGGTLGLRDEGAGVISALRGDGYQAGREESMRRDMEARAAFPDEFDRGRAAGTIGTMGAAAGGGLPAVGKGLIAHMTAGTAGGLGAGALEGQSDFEMAGRPRGERMDYYKWPMVAGAGAGLVAEPAARGVGAVARMGRNATIPTNLPYGRKPIGTMGNALTSNAEAGLDVQQYLSNLTDEAALVDVPGAPQTIGQGLATMQGRGSTELTRMVNERGETAGQRIRSEVDTRLGPADAAFNARRANAEERTGRWGPEYDAALASEAPVDVTGIIQGMDEAIATAGPDTAPVLERYASSLRQRAGEEGVVPAAALHWLRSDLSDQIDGLPTKRNVLLQGALRQVDEVLDTIPGYADARTGYASTRAMDRAIEGGREALRGGRTTATSPEEFRMQWDALSDAEKDAFSKGVREDVAALMGTSRNDAAAAWREFAKDWNEEKLRIVLGAEAEPLIRRLRSENVFSETRGRVDAGSQTGRRNEAREALGDYREPETQNRPGPVARVKQGVFDDPINNIIDTIRYGNRQGQNNADLGRMLSAQGSERDKIVRELLRYEMTRAQPTRSERALAPIVRALLPGAAVAAAP